LLFIIKFTKSPLPRLFGYENEITTLNMMSLKRLN